MFKNISCSYESCKNVSWKAPRAKETVFMFIWIPTSHNTRKEKQPPSLSICAPSCLDLCGLLRGRRRCTCFDCRDGGGARIGLASRPIGTGLCCHTSGISWALPFKLWNQMVAGTCISLNSVMKDSLLPGLCRRALTQTFIFTHRVHRCGPRCWWAVVCGLALDKGDFPGWWLLLDVTANNSIVCKWLGFEKQPDGPILRRDNTAGCVTSVIKHVLAVSNIYLFKKYTGLVKNTQFFELWHIKPLDLQLRQHR